MLAAQNLCFDRGLEKIFGPMSFELIAGEVLMLEGGNGSGKTSLMRVIAGLLQPTSGQIVHHAQSGDDLMSPVFLSHSGGQKQDLSPRENLDFSLRLSGARMGTSVASSLQSVGLEGFEDTPLRFLSAGQRKRSALAGVLMARSPLWLLDEPYANLDQHGVLLVNRLLETHCARQGAALITSHGLINPMVARLRRMHMVCSDE